MRLTTWAATLSCLTSIVVIVGTGIVRATEPLGSRTIPHPPSSERPVNPGPPLTAAGLLYDVSAYSYTCILPRFGPEPSGPTRAADGSWPRPGLTVAADWSVHPQGSDIIVEGLGPRRVTDKGHAIKGRKIDVFVASCREARAFGRRWLKVWEAE